METCVVLGEASIFHTGFRKAACADKSHVTPVGASSTSLVGNDILFLLLQRHGFVFGTGIEASAGPLLSLVVLPVQGEVVVYEAYRALTCTSLRCLLFQNSAILVPGCYNGLDFRYFNYHCIKHAA